METLLASTWKKQIPGSAQELQLIQLMKLTKKQKNILNGWRKDPRMVWLANPGRDLTKKEREEWERNITQYQI